ncbi:hypothetical protein Tco_1427261, partial [Tanacetum coccineum]
TEEVGGGGAGFLVVAVKRRVGGGDEGFLVVAVRMGIGVFYVLVRWRRLVSKISAIMIDHSLDGYLDGLQFGVEVSGGSEAILHTINHLIMVYGGDIGGFKKAFNFVDREFMLREFHLRCPTVSHWVEFCYSNPDIITGNTWYGHAKGCNRVTPLGP